MNTPARVIAIALPILVSTALCVWWTRTSGLMLGGDEPHYLIMARSVGLDGDFNLRNNYAEDELSGDIYGPVRPHAFHGGDVWTPYHSPGLGALLAIPLREAGFSGVRLTLIAWSALIPIAIFLWLHQHLTPALSLLLGVALAFSVPLGYGAFAIYPDLPAAAIMLVATLACLDFGTRRAAPPLWLWAAIWALVGFMPALQSRFIAAWLLLVAGGAVVAWRAPRDARARLLAGLIPAVVGVGLLFWFNAFYYGSVLGPPRWGELTRQPGRVIELFLGLHLDQSQGLFVQQPLWLLGVVGLAWFVRQQPMAAAWVTLIYLSAVLPAAMQMGRYGGSAPIGRYAWAVSFLWVIPIRSLVEQTGPRGERWFRAALIASVAVVTAMAARWMPAVYLLFPRLDDGLAVRDSLAPDALRAVMPSFYFWDFSSYWTHPPNVIAMAALLALAIAGAIQARDRFRDRPSRA